MAGDATDSSLTLAMRDFRKIHSNVTFKPVAGQGESGGTKYTSLDGLKMQLYSKNAPDVVFMDSVYITSAGYQNLLLDLSEYGSDEVQNKFIGSCWDSVKSSLEGEKKQFGLPFDCNTILQFYNKTLLDRAGVKTIPTNWDQLKSAMQLLDAMPEVTSPYTLMVNFSTGIGQKNYSAFQWMMWLWRLGGDVLDSNLKSAKFAEQPGIDALQMYVDMVQDYGVAKSYNVGEFLTGGTSGFTMMTNNLYNETVGNTQAKYEFGVDLLPELKAGTPRYSGLGLYALGLPNEITGAKDPAMAQYTAKTAYEFIEFYTTTLKYQMDYCNKTLLMPSLIEGKGLGNFTGAYWDVAYRAACDFQVPSWC